MTNDEMIEMARQAGYDNINEMGIYSFENFQLESFAKLVAEKEREACAKVCDDLSIVEGIIFSSFECATAIRARGEE